MRPHVFTLRVGEDDRVLELSFSRPPSRLFARHAYDAVNHEQLAAEISDSGWRTASIIVIEQRLDPRLAEDPRHVQMTNHILCGVIESEARRRLLTRYRSQEEAMALLEAKGVPLWERNHGPPEERAEEDLRFRGRLFDLVCEAQERLLYPELIAEHREEYESFREEGAEVGTWRDYLLELFLPRVETEHRRVHAGPEPLDRWDDRNDFQQWFFIAKDDAVHFVQGGSGSSAQREEMGRYAHVFATLARRHRRESPTALLEYGSDNALRLLERFDGFRAVDRELTGNYHADRAGVEELFAGRLVRVTDHRPSWEEPAP